LIATLTVMSSTITTMKLWVRFKSEFYLLFLLLVESLTCLCADDDLDEKADREIHDDTMSVASSSVASEHRHEADLDVPPYDWSQLPAHHCAYCGIHSTCSVVKCLGKDCNKWFCNGNSS
jgi:hypothetical protein